MGANSIKALTPTLAILNVRLGYWVANPRQLAVARKSLSVWDQFYFLQELLGLMRENSETVYLTDGGHIENLGIYELLRRRCRLIIAIDAEADPEMAFRSLVALQRYARIDLGRLDRSSLGRDLRCDASGVGGDRQDRRSPAACRASWSALRGRRNHLSAKSKGHLALCEIVHHWRRERLHRRLQASLSDLSARDDCGSIVLRGAIRSLSRPGLSRGQQVFLGNDNVGMRPKPAQWQGTVLTDPLVKEARDLLKWR